MSQYQSHPRTWRSSGVWSNDPQLREVRELLASTDKVNAALGIYLLKQADVGNFNVLEVALRYIDAKLVPPRIPYNLETTEQRRTREENSQNAVAGMHDVSKICAAFNCYKEYGSQLSYSPEHTDILMTEYFKLIAASWTGILSWMVAFTVYAPAADNPSKLFYIASTCFFKILSDIPIRDDWKTELLEKPETMDCFFIYLRHHEKLHIADFRLRLVTRDTLRAILGRYLARPPHLYDAFITRILSVSKTTRETILASLVSHAVGGMGDSALDHDYFRIQKHGTMPEMRSISPEQNEGRKGSNEMIMSEHTSRVRSSDVREADLGNHETKNSRTRGNGFVGWGAASAARRREGLAIERERLRKVTLASKLFEATHKPKTRASEEGTRRRRPNQNSGDTSCAGSVNHQTLGVGGRETKIWRSQRSIRMYALAGQAYDEEESKGPTVHALVIKDSRAFGMFLRHQLFSKLVEAFFITAKGCAIFHSLHPAQDLPWQLISRSFIKLLQAMITSADPPKLILASIRHHAIPLLLICMARSGMDSAGTDVFERLSLSINYLRTYLSNTNMYNAGPGDLKKVLSDSRVLGRICSNALWSRIWDKTVITLNQRKNCDFNRRHCSKERPLSPDSALRQCTKCLSVAYCSSECQHEDWISIHREECDILSQDKTSPRLITSMTEEMRRNQLVYLEHCMSGDSFETLRPPELGIDQPIVAAHVFHVIAEDTRTAHYRDSGLLSEVPWVDQLRNPSSAWEERISRRVLAHMDVNAPGMLYYSRMYTRRARAEAMIWLCNLNPGDNQQRNMTRPAGSSPHILTVISHSPYLLFNFGMPGVLLRMYLSGVVILDSYMRPTQMPRGCQLVTPDYHCELEYGAEIESRDELELRDELEIR
ncbi:hypothetical protein DFP72DRAFT_1039442 [Ephemerocybe angulata]|uniref:MYND-type domain-containing protein n=1 Tax=Ephemerocybe angulata TaxID=980116 RepID=A0A8H6MGG6_9AGAR|nr:hypothetical protein DFP72DRAFT_1039442 [Tulosesus angulatus]